MTREEALNVIADMCNALQLHPNSRQGEAMMMAINSLKNGTPSAENKEDLISRQAVLDMIEREQFKGDAISEIEKLPSIENKGEWIPLSERPPEDKQEVIVSYENKDGEFVTKGKFDKKYGFNYPNVKAWMPLPEPYKAERGE